MATPMDLLENIQALDIDALAVESLSDGAEVIVKFQEEQLSEGQRGDDTMIAPPYSPFTILEKSKKDGLAGVTDHVTLFDTGAHYAGLFAQVRSKVILYGSTDPKSRALQDKYGKIYGLNTDSRQYFIEDYLADRFFGKIERLTGLEASLT